MLRKLGWVGIGLIALILAFLLAPDWFFEVTGIAKWFLPTATYPLLQILVLRGAIGVMALSFGLLLVVIGGIRFRLIRRGAHGLVLGVILLAAGGAQFGILGARGLTNPAALPTDPGFSSGGPGDGTVTVATLNTNKSRANVDAVTKEIKVDGVDVIGLPETSAKYAQELVAKLAEQGETFYEYHLNADASAIDQQAVLISAHLGPYVMTTANQYSRPGIVLRPANPADLETHPNFVMLHLQSPDGKLLQYWRGETAAALEACGKDRIPGTVIFGDFNATRDHATLRQAIDSPANSCADAAQEAGFGGVGTWPAGWPTWLGITIDHVFADTTRYQAATGRVVDIPGAKQRMVITRLRPVKPLPQDQPEGAQPAN